MYQMTACGLVFISFTTSLTRMCQLRKSSMERSYVCAPKVDKTENLSQAVVFNPRPPESLYFSKRND